MLRSDITLKEYHNSVEIYTLLKEQSNYWGYVWNVNIDDRSLRRYQYVLDFISTIVRIEFILHKMRVFKRKYPEHIL